ncbi:MAG: hypothetical protein DMF00_06790 [Verrucomicrobia bacterium]|nr:MAG: hypothetical protein DMF00_06790 [Verrucomicrobiota bacterium]
MLAPEETPLVIEDRLARMNLLPTALSFNHRIDEAFEFFPPAPIDTKPMQRVRMDESNFCRNSARQSGLKHCL